jgi:hypothetical protein
MTLTIISGIFTISQPARRLRQGPMTALSMSERYRASKAPWRILPARNYPA